MTTAATEKILMILFCSRLMRPRGCLEQEVDLAREEIGVLAKRAGVALDELDALTRIARRSARYWLDGGVERGSVRISVCGRA